MLTISENNIVVSWVEVMMDVGRISSKPNSVSLLKPVLTLVYLYIMALPLGIYAGRKGTILSILIKSQGF
ncbi:MAG: hypothetical protein D4R76_10760 [Methylococcus sp.]|nr:MAG: hypothetical protein D4R76_10760 [Methylococcus sp.]